MEIMKRYLYFILIGFIFATCKKENTINQAEADEKIITDYITNNNLKATATGSGLYYVMTTEGNGARPTLSSQVTVKYKGYLTNGTVFDETTNTGASFGLASVIKGWQEGIPLFKRGGKGVLLIPSALGYGTQAVNKIPANSVLIFDIDLLDVK